MTCCSEAKRLKPSRRSWSMPPIPPEAGTTSPASSRWFPIRCAPPSDRAPAASQRNSLLINSSVLRIGERGGTMSEIKTVGVLGAGTMGNGIAHAFARSGFKVWLCDIDQPSLNRGIEIIHKNLGREVFKQKITEDDMEEALSRITGTLDRGALGRCDF